MTPLHFLSPFEWAALCALALFVLAALYHEPPTPHQGAPVVRPHHP